MPKAKKIQTNLPDTPRSKGRPAKIQGALDYKQAINMRLQGLSYDKIAGALGVTRQTLYYHLSPLFKMLGDTSQLQVYRENKADMLEGIQARLARSMVDESKIEKATLGNVAYAMEKLNNIMRLERDQSTSNVAIAHIEALETIADVDAEIEAITEQLQDSYNVAPECSKYATDENLQALESEIERIKTKQVVDITDDPFEGCDE